MSGGSERSNEPTDRIGPRRGQRFDGGWRFWRGDGAGFERPDVVDDDWRGVDLPHDWSIEDVPPDGAEPADGTVVPVTAELWAPPTVPERVGPFDRRRSEGTNATGWTLGGVGWYRKHFLVGPLAPDAVVEVWFDGVSVECEVWCNGHRLGDHVDGYTPFGFDLTPHLDRSGDNVLAVRVANVGANSRWYTGSGIYRHVWVDVTGPLRFARFGVGVTTPVVGDEAAEVRVAALVDGARPGAMMATRLLGPDGREVARAAVPVAAEVETTLMVERPRRWSPEVPSLHRAVTELVVGSDVVDRMVTSFGVRQVLLDARDGLRINGRSLKLRGGCVHHDNGLLGAAAFDRAEERRVELLKARGYNAVRCAHNPPSPAFLDTCDRLGVLVIDEAFDMWTEPKTPDDYHRWFPTRWRDDLSTMVLRDRNHPSVIMWSIGNEIAEKTTLAGVEIQSNLAAECRRLDPTRPVTAAVDSFAGRPVVGRTGRPDQPATMYLDAVGYNYRWREYELDHETYPDRVMYGSESHPPAMWVNWERVEALPHVIGDFVWSAMDYLGEAGIGGRTLEPADGARGFLVEPGYPWFNAYCGDIDITGRQKAASLARDVLWGVSTLEVTVRRPAPPGFRELTTPWGWPDELASWTWPGAEGRVLTVRVYTCGDRVEVTRGGEVVGRHHGDARPGVLEFPVAYAPGTLVVSASRHGAEIGRRTLETVGPAARLTVRAERPTMGADRGDVGYLDVDVTDEDGRPVPDAVVGVTVDVSGPGQLIALGSANPLVNGGFGGPSTRTFQGSCLAVVRSTGRSGEIRVEASAEGLEGAAAVIVAA